MVEVVPACQPLEGTLYGRDLDGTEAKRVQNFANNVTLQEQATCASPPARYTQVFHNCKCLHTNTCNSTLDCWASNIYFKRSPS